MGFLHNLPIRLLDMNDLDFQCGKCLVVVTHIRENTETSIFSRRSTIAFCFCGQYLRAIDNALQKKKKKIIKRRVFL